MLQKFSVEKQFGRIYWEKMANIANKPNWARRANWANS